MLFTLKKIISAFFMPLSIGLLLFLFGLFALFFKSYKKAKIYLTLSFLWLCIVSYSPFANYITKPLEQKYPAYINVDKSVKYVLVLGSGHETNKNISSLSQLSQTALMRLGEGIRIFRELNDAKLIVSGYAGPDKVPHAFVSKDVAISLGVPKSKILTQEKAKDTFEEALYAKKVIGDNKFILVTSASHMPRAMAIFKNAKMNPIAAPTDYLSKGNGDFFSIPKVSHLRKTDVSMHEYLGILYNNFLNFITKPKD
ncbi:MAG: ElyC/SanA/YdcF family protein [Halarcobacter sp.]